MLLCIKPCSWTGMHQTCLTWWQTQTSGSMSMPACASSKMSNDEKLMPSQASVFCPQTTASDPIPAAAYFLISSCPLSLTSQAGRYHRHSTEHVVTTSFQKSDWNQTRPSHPHFHSKATNIWSKEVPHKINVTQGILVLSVNYTTVRNSNKMLTIRISEIYFRFW